MAVKAQPREKMSLRQQQIVTLVQGQGFVSIDWLARHLGVTPQTVRRDIKHLAAGGRLRRHHGGVDLPMSAENHPYTARQVLYLAEKRRIAALLARQIPDKASCLIGIGTTNEEVAKQLVDRQGLRVITNNLNVAAILGNNDNCEVLVAGGRIRNRDRCTTGPATIDFITQFKADFGILGAGGIDAEGTLLDFDYQDVRVAQAIIANSRTVFLAADHSKFGRNAMVRLAPLSAVDALFTDRPPGRAIQDLMAAHQVQLHVAGG
jgi:DeoR family glycerol-3-phosphate regulon repressor